MNLIDFIKIATLLAATNGGALTLSDKNVQIMAGHPIDISEAPFQVILLFDGMYGGLTWCGGSIIAEDLILTAAQCVINRFTNGIEPFKVGAGSSEIPKIDEAQYISTHKVKNILFHENYTRWDNDVALLRLEKPLEFNNKVNKVELAPAGATVDGGVLCNVTGWSLTNSENARELRLATIPVLDRKTCREWFGSFASKITDNMMCAGTEEGSKDMCLGESGSPLVCNGVQFGIVSHGLRPCDGKKKPTVYTYIPTLRKWIDEHIGMV